MITEERMNIDERYKYLRKMRKRYDSASRKERSQLLCEMEIMTNLHRKSLIRLLHQPGPVRKQRRKQRGRGYSHRVDDAIRVVGESLDWICAERLQPTLAETVKHLAVFGEMQLSDDLLGELEAVSISTVHRIIKRVRQDEYRLPQKRGKPRYDSGVIAQIPARRIPWNEAEPGHFEVDTVFHCGPDASGDFVLSLQAIDVATGWSERCAIFGRGQRETVRGFDIIRERCPIPLREIHPDNGPEFMNHHLFRYFGETVKGVRLSRSYRYRKNDNRFVEAKNFTLIRAYLGHVRLDTRSQLQLLNALYDDMWLYYNFFQPVLRQTEKTFSYDQLGVRRVHRKHDTARTPLQRLLGCDVLHHQTREHLTKLYQSTNPRQLRLSIHRQLDQLFDTTTHN